jgi:hypothetical protein
MKLLTFIRLIVTFYKNFLPATFSITASCIAIFWEYGLIVVPTLFWFKVITLAMVFFFIRTYKVKEFYYYQNLGISEMVLWVATFSFDFVLFIVSLIITYQLT